MANNLPSDKKAQIVSNLAENASIRAIERMTGVHRDTVMRLGVRVGGVTNAWDSGSRLIASIRILSGVLRII